MYKTHPQSSYHIGCCKFYRALFCTLFLNIFLLLRATTCVQQYFNSYLIQLYALYLDFSARMKAVFLYKDLFMPGQMSM